MAPTNYIDNWRTIQCLETEFRILGLEKKTNITALRNLKFATAINVIPIVTSGISTEFRRSSI